MNQYEAMIILQPHATPDKVQEDIQKVKDVITKQRGVVQSEIKWGKRGMAYPIRKKREGYYIVLEFQAEPSAIKPMMQAYRLLDQEVIRVMILQKDRPEAVQVA